MSAASPVAPAVEHFSIWGTGVTLAVTEAAALPDARKLLNAVLKATTMAASRFEPESEISRLNAQGSIVASPWFLHLVRTAHHGYLISEGLCDPTVLNALMSLGYDQDFDALTPRSEPVPQLYPAPGWSAITLHSDNSIHLESGVTIDLGATAKAAAADEACTTIAEQLRCGVLVDLGGDIRIQGTPPVDGWAIGLAMSAKNGLEGADITEVISLHGGAIASSSSVIRTWKRANETLHHIVDPRTGKSADTPWAMASVIAHTAVEANALSTAAIIWGEDAVFELAQRSIQARLVRHNGTIERVGDWAEPRGES